MCLKSSCSAVVGTDDGFLVLVSALDQLEAKHKEKLFKSPVKHLKYSYIYLICILLMTVVGVMSVVGLSLLLQLKDTSLFVMPSLTSHCKYWDT